MGHPGECKTFLHLIVDRKAEAVIALNPKLSVNPERGFLEEVARQFGTDCTEVIYKSTATH